MTQHHLRKRIGSTIALILFTTMGLCACLDVKERLVVRPDGSGTLSIEVRSDMSVAELNNMLGFGMELPEARRHYPPTTMDSLRILFPGERFHIEEIESSPAPFSAKIHFRDINDILGSPYADLKSMEVGVEEGRLYFRTRTGLDVIAVCRSVEDAASNPQYGPMLKELCDPEAETSYELTLTLPGEAKSQNGQVSGSDVTWKISNKDNAASGIGFTEVLGATCPAEHLGFSPQSPVRLDLRPFTALAAGKTSVPVERPSATSYRGQLRFQPLELTLNRSFVISSPGGENNLAHLIGLISVPENLAPDKWGAVRLVEALDSDGTDLLLSPGRNPGLVMVNGKALDRFDGHGPGPSDSDRVQHVVSLSFKSPSWTSRNISRLKGEIDLIHFTGQSIVKIEDALTRDQVLDGTRPGGPNYGSPRSQRIVNPALQDSGIELVIMTAMDMGVAQVVFMQAKSTQSTLEDIGFFDRDGNPQPCIVSENSPGWGDEGARMFVAILPGRPRPPLSMACRIRSSGDPITLSFEITNLSVMKERTDP